MNNKNVWCISFSFCCLEDLGRLRVVCRSFQQWTTDQEFWKHVYLLPYSVDAPTLERIWEGIMEYHTYPLQNDDEWQTLCRRLLMQFAPALAPSEIWDLMSDGTTIVSLGENLYLIDWVEGTVMWVQSKMTQEQRTLLIIPPLVRDEFCRQPMIRDFFRHPFSDRLWNNGSDGMFRPWPP